MHWQERHGVADSADADRMYDGELRDGPGRRNLRDQQGTRKYWADVDEDDEFDLEQFRFHNARRPIQIAEHLPEIEPPLVKPAVEQKNYGDDQAKTVNSTPFETCEMPVTKCACGGKIETKYGCRECARAFMGFRRENERWTVEGMERSARIRDDVLKAFPLNDFEVVDTSYVTPLPKEEVFADDAQGSPNILKFGVTSSRKIPHYPKNPSQGEIGKLIERARDFGLNTAKLVPMTDAGAVRSSLAANSTKKKSDPFKGTVQQLQAFTALSKVKFESVRFDKESLMMRARKVISDLDLSKSAGFDGLQIGATSKGLFLTQIGEENLAAAAVVKVMRHAFVGADAAFMTTLDKYLAGMRSIVVGQIKKELHDQGKVFEPARDGSGKVIVDEKGDTVWALTPDGAVKWLEHPRWRSILIQGITDHVAAQILFKEHLNNIKAAVQNKVPGCLQTGSGIGFSSNDAGITALLDDFDEMRKVSKDEVLVTSDVTGMDFCLGGLVAAYPYYATLCETTKSEDFKRAAMSSQTPGRI